MYQWWRLAIPRIPAELLNSLQKFAEILKIYKFSKFLFRILKAHYLENLLFLLFRIQITNYFILESSIVIHQLAWLLNLTSLASLLGYPDSVKGQIVCLQRKDLG